MNDSDKQAVETVTAWLEARGGIVIGTGVVGPDGTITCLWVPDGAMGGRFDNWSDEGRRCCPNRRSRVGDAELCNCAIHTKHTEPTR